jgi:hypothetical protein
MHYICIIYVCYTYNSMRVCIQSHFDEEFYFRMKRASRYSNPPSFMASKRKLPSAARQYISYVELLNIADERSKHINVIQSSRPKQPTQLRHFKSHATKARLGVQSGRINVVLFPRAVHLCDVWPQWRMYSYGFAGHGTEGIKLRGTLAFGRILKRNLAWTCIIRPLLTAPV